MDTAALLVVITWMSGYVRGPVVSMQEFSQLSRCEGAAETIRREAKVWDIGDSRIRVFCISR